MDEWRKCAILFAATILCARKMAGIEPAKPNFTNLAKESPVGREVATSQSGTSEASERKLNLNSGERVFWLSLRLSFDVKRTAQAECSSTAMSLQPLCRSRRGSTLPDRTQVHGPN